MPKRSVNTYLMIMVIAVLLYSVLLYGGTVFLQEQISGGLVQSTKADKVEVELRPTLPLGLLSGDFSAVRLVLENAQLGPLQAHSVIVNGKDVDVSVFKLATSGVFTINRVGEMAARLDLTSDDLNAYFDSLALPAGQLKAAINTDHFQLSGNLPLLGRNLETILYGRFTVLPGNKLRIVPVRLILQNAEVPSVLVEQFIADYLIIPLDLSSLPVDLTISEVRLSEGRVSVYASQE